MPSLKTIVASTLLVSAVAANPLFAKRQSATTCGDNQYTATQVTNAANAACNYVSDGSDAGDSDYPHEYENYEGFNFPVSGPWYEFPILEDGVYDGGSPGADRVIINDNCEYAGTITHTGASSEDGFVGCSGTS